MNSFKLLALVGAVAAHDHPDDENDRRLQQKQDFLQTCSQEVPMCEEIIAKEANKQFVIVDPSEPIPADPTGSGSGPSDIARQCFEDFLADCLPDLESQDPVAISKCIVENRREIFLNVKNISEECKQAFRDLAPKLPQRRRRHAGGRHRDHGKRRGGEHQHRHHHEHDGERDDDNDDDANRSPYHHRGHHRDHERDDDDDNLKQISQAAMHLSAPGAEIGACLLKNTQNLTAPCLSAVETVNATGDDWSFLDAEEEEEHFNLKHNIAACLVFFSLITTCCCLYYKNKKRNSRAGVPAGFPGAVIPSSAARLPVSNSSHTFPGASIQRPSGPTVTNTFPGAAIQVPASRPCPRAVDVQYTGAANRQALLSAGAIPSDQYI